MRSGLAVLALVGEVVAAAVVAEEAGRATKPPATASASLWPRLPPRLPLRPSSTTCVSPNPKPPLGRNPRPALPLARIARPPRASRPPLLRGRLRSRQLLLPRAPIPVPPLLAPSATPLPLWRTLWLCAMCTLLALLLPPLLPLPLTIACLASCTCPAPRSPSLPLPLPLSLPPAQPPSTPSFPWPLPCPPPEQALERCRSLWWTRSWSRCCTSWSCRCRAGPTCAPSSRTFARRLARATMCRSVCFVLLWRS